MPAHRARLAGGLRHFQHGPIDLVIGADGDPGAVEAAHEAAWSRFETLLDELVAELPTLKRAVAPTSALEGIVAQRMWIACRPHRARFLTPMAAVAGAVADEVVAAYRRDGIARAWVNNGGDIALHLAPGHALRVGLFADLARFDPSAWRGVVSPDGSFAIDASTPVRGIATSGWRGRSFSLGIADSVTVLASNAAAADAAATMIANAVDLDDARIVRRPASSLKDDSDLGGRLVTVDVPTLEAAAVRRAMQAGLDHAKACKDAGLVDACVLVCQGQVRTTGEAALSRLESPPPRVAWRAPRSTGASREAIA